MAEESKRYAGKGLLLLASVLLLIQYVFYLPTQAASLTNRSIILGSVKAGATTDHKFQFNLTTAGSLGSIAFEYCESPLFDVPCVAPSGIDASGATIISQTGETGFSIHPNTVSNRIVITRPVALAASGTVSYDFGNIVNPDTPNHTTYMRISTYSNIDATGVYVDNGVAAFSIVPSLGVNVFVPPYLTFCAGVTVGLQCQSASGVSINLGDFSSGRTSFATTQFAGATNDNTGYNVSVLGTTLTSGNNTINRLVSKSQSRTGIEQFGINLRNNSSPDVGHNREGSGTLAAASAYNSPNLFKFEPGEIISSSSMATEFNRMTVSYIINISPDQPLGVYSTTLTYTAVASF
ncbi:MAG TPA: hypothetical protein VFW77_03870 [Candidatus Saccharimonadales bacterium]|nr:hypothetical protein [Candidatus Saccharimonadales bacterium]